MSSFGTLYAAASNPRIRKIRAAAALNGLELTLPEDFEPYKSSRTPEYLAKFPLGKVPGFESAAGDFRLIESGAILSYVAESGPRREQLLGSNARERAQNQQWVLFNDLQIEQSLYPVLVWRLGYGPHDAAKEAAGAADLKRWLDYAESHMADRTWFVNAPEAGPGLPDLVIGSAMALLCASYLDAAARPAYPGLVRLVESLQKVPEIAELYTVPMIEKRREPEDEA